MAVEVCEVVADDDLDTVAVVVTEDTAVLVILEVAEEIEAELAELKGESSTSD